MAIGTAVLFPNQPGWALHGSPAPLVLIAPKGQFPWLVLRVEPHHPSQLPGLGLTGSIPRIGVLDTIIAFSGK